MLHIRALKVVVKSHKSQINDGTRPHTKLAVTSIYNVKTCKGIQLSYILNKVCTVVTLILL